MIFLSQRAKIRGNLDTTVPTWEEAVLQQPLFEPFIRSPIALIGLDGPFSFQIERLKSQDKKSRCLLLDPILINLVTKGNAHGAQGGGTFRGSWRLPHWVRRPTVSALNGPKVVWANQWEPSTRKQHAAEVYAARWGSKPQENRPTCFVHPSNDDDVLVNEDIATVDASEIPEHDILCGGFPCQDYSVAKTLDKATGLGGKKGVLWWEIHRIASHHKPRFLLLENVDGC